MLSTHTSCKDTPVGIDNNYRTCYTGHTCGVGHACDACRTCDGGRIVDSDDKVHNVHIHYKQEHLYLLIHALLDGEEPGIVHWSLRLVKPGKQLRLLRKAFSYCCLLVI
jgi:hypothetical protein